MVLTLKNEEFGQNLSRCHFVYHKSYISGVGLNPSVLYDRSMTSSMKHGMVSSTFFLVY